MRKVRGLKEVVEVAEPGNRRGGTRDFAPAAGEGLRFEKALALHAASKGLRVKHGQWFKFRDSKGVSYCQTDVLAMPIEADRILLLEAKLTQKAEGEIKLERLYVPVVRALYKVPIFPILVFKNIIAAQDRMLKSLDEALALPRREAEKVYHLHWSAL
jgi:hypothetical protein